MEKDDYEARLVAAVNKHDEERRQWWAERERLQAELAKYASAAPGVAAEGRELRVDELDVEGGLTWIMFLGGAALMALSKETRQVGAQKETVGDAYWRHIPLQKALAQLGRENPGRLRELWAEALREPMPFGGPPIGMPRVEVKP